MTGTVPLADFPTGSFRFPFRGVVRFYASIFPSLIRYFHFPPLCSPNTILLVVPCCCVVLTADLEFSILESWSGDVSRPIFTSLGLGLGLEPQSHGLGLGLGEASLNPSLIDSMKHMTSKLHNKCDIIVIFKNDWKSVLKCIHTVKAVFMRSCKVQLG